MRGRIKNKKSQYQLILLANNENIQLYSSHWNKKKAIQKFNDMLKENKKIVFPMEHINSKKIKEVKYHLAMIKRKDKDSNETSPKLKNEYGEYVDHIVEDNDEWIMYLKEPYYFEETFWVYGYNPKVQRKTFDFIYDELVKKHATNKYEFLNVWLYKNKIMMESASHTELVICKCKDDAVRVVNEIERRATQDKLKYIMFSGDKSTNRKDSHWAIERIMKLTNWNDRKVTRYCTRP